MNSHELKELLQFIENSLTCRNCKNHYRASDIFVIATLLNEGFLIAACASCRSQAFLNFVIEKTDKKVIGIRIKNPSSHSISVDDVIEIHNFLKNHKGSLKELLK